MATRTATAAGGTWNVATTWVEGVVPTAADDVVLNATSGNVTIGVAGNCRSIDCTGYTATLNTNGTLNIGTTTPGPGNVALKFSPTMTFIPSASSIHFAATSATQQTIDFAGKQLGPANVYFSASGSWILASAFDGDSAALHVDAGTFDSNGYDINIYSFYISGPTATSIFLRNSHVAVSGSVSVSTATNLTFNAGTSVFDCLSTAGLMGVVGLSYNEVRNPKSFTGSSNNTFATLVVDAVDTLTVNVDQVVTGTLSLLGADARLNRLKVTGAAGKTITAANVVARNVDFKQVKAAGTANWNLSAIPGGAGDGGGNQGITFTAPVTQTWQGRLGGNWSDVAKWTSRVPLPQDDVVLGAFDPDQTVTVDMVRMGHFVDFSQITGSPLFQNSDTTLREMTGNLIVPPNVQFASMGPNTFRLSLFNALDTGNYDIAVRCNAIRYLSIDGENTTWTFQADWNFITTDTEVAGSVYLWGGNLNFNGRMFRHDNGSFISNGSRKSSVAFGPYMRLGNSLSIGTESALFTATQTNNLIVDLQMPTNGTSVSVTAGGHTLGTVRWRGGSQLASTFTISDSPTYRNLVVDAWGYGRTLRITKSTTLTVLDDMTLYGQAGTLLSIISTTAGTPATISKPSGTARCDYLSLKDSTATGGATFYAGSHSTNVSGNTGWLFQDSPVIVAAAGGGNWNATATWVGGVVPTATSDVVLNATSGNVTITASAFCRSLDCTGYAGTLTHNNFSLSIGSSIAGPGLVALKFSPTMTFTAGTFSIAFVSTSPVQQSIFTAGKTISGLVFTGVGGSWIFLDDVTTKSGQDIGLTGGTLDTNNRLITTSSFTSNSSSVRSLTLGTSTINLMVTSGSSVWSVTSPGTLTFDGASSTMVIGAASASARTFAGAGLTYGTLTYTTPGSSGGLTITGNNTFAAFNVSDGTSSRTLTLPAGQVNTFGVFNVSGTAAKPITIGSSAAGTAATISVPSGTVNSTGLSLKDNVATGGATFNATHSLIQSNVTGWNVSYVVKVVPAGGNWNTAATWDSLAVPTANADVVADATSGDLVLTGTTAFCRSIDFTGYTRTFTHSVALNIGASTAGPNNIAMKLSPTMTWTNGSGSISFVSTAALPQTITSAGLQFPQVALNSVGGTWRLIDDFTSSSSLTLSQGSLDTNNCAVTAYTLQSNTSNVRSLTLGTSTITLTSLVSTVWSIGNATNMTLSALSSTIVIGTPSTSARTFAGGGLAYGTLTYLQGNSGQLTITGNNTFNTFNLNATSTSGRTLQMPAGGTNTFGTFNVSGSTGKIVTINSSLAGTASTISVPTGGVSTDYLSLQDSAATGSGQFYAGTHSTNVSGNSGWLFQSPPMRTATAAGGNWNNPATWIEGSVPTAAEEVIFNASSGNVTLTANAVCRSLNATGYTGTFDQLSYNLSIGDGTAGTGNVALLLSPGMTFNTSGGTISFVSTAPQQQSVTTNGKSPIVTFNGAGSSWVLADALTCQGVSTLMLVAGSLDTNGMNVSCGYFNSTGTSARSLTLRTSTISLTSGTGRVWDVDATGLTLNAGASTIAIVSASASNRTFAGSGFTYGTLSYTVPNSSGQLSILGANTFGTLNFTDAVANRVLRLPASTTTTCGTFNVNGRSGWRITLASTSDGTRATLSVPSGNVICQYLSIQDSAATGGATFNAKHSTAYNTTGWIVSEATTALPAGGAWESASTWDTGVVPNDSTDVLLDATSGNVSISSAVGCRSLDCTGYTGTFTWSGTLELSGPGPNNVILLLSPGMSIVNNGSGSATFRGSVGTPQTITTNGQYLYPTFQGPGGSWKLLDDLRVFPGRGVIVTRGTLDTNGKAVTASYFNSFGGQTRSIILGSSVITTDQWSMMDISGLTLSAASSTIVLTQGAASRIFYGGGQTYGTVTYTSPGSTGALQINGSNSFNILNFSDAISPRTLQFERSTTNTFNIFNVTGGPGRVLTLSSDLNGTVATVSVPSGTVNVDSAQLYDNIATGGATFNATHSVAQQNVIGWNVTNDPWVNSELTLVGIG